MIGKWGGPRFSTLLQRIGADIGAKYVGYRGPDGYHGGTDMATALHPQTIMATTFADRTLPRKYGCPWKLRVPTRLGFRNPKWIATLYVTDRFPGGFWEDRGYNWFSGL